MLRSGLRVPLNSGEYPGGSYLDLMRRWKRPVFFDQQGQLTDKLGIRHVPALVTQDGKRLKIEEILR